MGIFSGMPSLLSQTHINLKAEAHKNTVELSWDANHESTFMPEQHLLQRSDDLQLWETIYETASPSSSTLVTKNFSDHPKKGTWYYRVLLPDHGLSSNIVAATLFNPNASMRLFPNPAKHEVTVAFSRETSGVLQLFNNEGKLVMEHLIRDAEKHLLPLNQISSGVYMMIFSNSATIERQKLWVH